MIKITSKKKLVKIDPDIHLEISVKAAMEQKTIEAIVDQALREYLDINGVNVE